MHFAHAWSWDMASSFTSVRDTISTTPLSSSQSDSSSTAPLSAHGTSLAWQNHGLVSSHMVSLPETPSYSRVHC